MALGLLHWEMQWQGSYAGARWDAAGEVLKELIPVLITNHNEIAVRSAVFLPQWNKLAWWFELWKPGALPWGGFLAVGLRK